MAASLHAPIGVVMQGKRRGEDREKEQAEDKGLEGGGG